MILTTLAAIAIATMNVEKQKIGVQRAKAEGKYKGRPINPETKIKCEKALTAIETMKKAVKNLQKKKPVTSLELVLLHFISILEN